MNKVIMAKFKRFCNECKVFLNKANLQYCVGKNRISLAAFSLNEIIEKNVISFTIDFFGKDNVKYGSWSGYDVIIIDLEGETVYVNIKTNLSNPNMDGTWLCSASVIERLKKRGILEYLYCTKFEYIKEHNILKFISGKVAGPISDIQLIYYTKGETTKYRMKERI